MSKLENILSSLSDFKPEVSLAALFVLLITTDLIFRKRSYQWLPYLTLAGLVLVWYYTIWQFEAYAIPQNKFIFFKAAPPQSV